MTLDREIIVIKKCDSLPLHDALAGFASSILDKKSVQTYNTISSENLN